MLDDFLNSLNPMQRKAAELGCENALVLAGAGSGKTKVLTTRIALLLSRAMARPSQILAVTFTNKAAREMRDRLSAMVSCDLRHFGGHRFESDYPPQQTNAKQKCFAFFIYYRYFGV